jgi:hypothetical protein
VRGFVKHFAGSFDIGANGVQIGAATFDTQPRNEFWLNSHFTNASLQHAIDQIKYPAGNTHTAEALDFIRQNAFTTVRSFWAQGAQLSGPRKQYKNSCCSIVAKTSLSYVDGSNSSISDG